MSGASLATASAPAHSPVVPRSSSPLPPDNPATAIAERIRANGSVCLRTQGMSMFPWIRPNDLVFVRRRDFAMVRPGDVILFTTDGRYFVHRVLRRAPSAIITKGDALDGADAPVTRDQFLGRAIRIHRRRRHMDLESLGYVAFGRLLALVSPFSRSLYFPLRVARRILFGPPPPSGSPAAPVSPIAPAHKIDAPRC